MPTDGFFDIISDGPLHRSTSAQPSCDSRHHFHNLLQKIEEVNWKSATGVLLLSGAIILAVMIGIVQYLPRVAAFFDRIFVNGRAPFNLGSDIPRIAPCGLLLWNVPAQEEREGDMHTIVLSLPLFLSVFDLCRRGYSRKRKYSTNEYQPDNPYTLVRYLSREQYGSNPIIYGQAYTAPYDIKTVNYYTPLDGRYYKAENIEVVFPRRAKCSSQECGMQQTKNMSNI